MPWPRARRQSREEVGEQTARDRAVPCKDRKPTMHTSRMVRPDALGDAPGCRKRAPAGSMPSTTSTTVRNDCRDVRSAGALEDRTNAFQLEAAPERKEPVSGLAPSSRNESPRQSCLTVGIMPASWFVRPICSSTVSPPAERTLRRSSALKARHIGRSRSAVAKSEQQNPR